MKQNTFSDIISRVNLIAVIDHSGRAGNVFFLTIFDQHPEVICCPWIHYIYSYVITNFGDKERLDSKIAHDFAIKSTYFKYVYNDLDDQLSFDLYKIGADINSIVDRKTVRQVFDEYVLELPTITRKKLILLMYLSFAMGINKDISKVKYIVVSDAPSLRTENVLTGFSGITITAMKNDYDNAKLISLVRDPRANFASNRHQFINSFGNMYDIKLGNYFKQFYLLITRKFRMNYGCVFLFWLCYFSSTARTIFDLKIRFRNNFITIKNESLNLNFINTISSIIDWLDIKFIEEWNNTNYHPTMVGMPWAGNGAYNNRYQKVLNGPLSNDPLEISVKVTGPNKYVTERWKKKMSDNEIYVIEKLFYQEMIELKYDFMFYKAEDSYGRFVFELFKPFVGEIPRLSWIKNGKSTGMKEVFNRIFYSISFIPFYISSRIILMNLISHNFFTNKNINKFNEVS